MRYQYGEKMLLRILDEVEFWKRQEAEHTVVIRALAPDLEPQFVEALKQWQQALAEVEGLADRYIETLVRYGDSVPSSVSESITGLVEFSLQQSQHFLALLDVLKEQSHVITNPVVLVVIDHIRRESEYFIGVAQVVLFGEK